jgi:hypothetical protein
MFILVAILHLRSPKPPRGFLRRADEKLEAGQVRRIIAALTKSAATWNSESIAQHFAFA